MTGAHELRAITADGVALALRRTPPVGSGRGAALLTHAMMVDGRYLDRLATALAGDGLDVFVLDWRGHGASRPPDPRRDRWTFDDYVTMDLPCALAAVAHAAGCPRAEVGLLGHSLGGLVALAALGTGTVDVARVALIATSVWLPGPRGPWRRRALMATYAAVAGALGYAPIRALRLGTADEPASYVAQLTGWARSGRWATTGGVDYLAAVADVRARVQAWVGAGDRLCTPADARAVLAGLPAAPVHVVGRAAGDALDPDHFTLFTRPAMAPRWRTWADALTR
ncbi:MAG: alpha/beta fold hydrolase [Myxococcales bacterium]|nr:alpha/beta fold hydrolase [Myxococcales bacterium]